MAVVSVGDVVFVRFPFSDLSQSKLRPALVLAEVDRGDMILCQITSRDYADCNAVLLQPEDFVQGGLLKVSYVRPSKLFTANHSIVEKVVAHVATDLRRGVVEQIVALLGVA
jgi:mRNA interferase MazF